MLYNCSQCSTLSRCLQFFIIYLQISSLLLLSYLVLFILIRSTPFYLISIFLAKYLSKSLVTFFIFLLVFKHVFRTHNLSATTCSPSCSQTDFAYYYWIDSYTSHRLFLTTRCLKNHQPIKRPERDTKITDENLFCHTKWKKYTFQELANILFKYFLRTSAHGCFVVMLLKPELELSMLFNFYMTQTAISEPNCNYVSDSTLPTVSATFRSGLHSNVSFLQTLSRDLWWLFYILISTTLVLLQFRTMLKTWNALHKYSIFTNACTLFLRLQLKYFWAYFSGITISQKISANAVKVVNKIFRNVSKTFTCGTVWLYEFNVHAIRLMMLKHVQAISTKTTMRVISFRISTGTPF